MGFIVTGERRAKRREKGFLFAQASCLQRCCQDGLVGPPGGHCISELHPWLRVASGHVCQVSLSYSATRILHSTLHSSLHVVFVEEHVSCLVSVTCSVVCSGQFAHNMRKSWPRCVTMRTSRTPAKILTLSLPRASPWCAQALPVTAPPSLALSDPPSHFTKLSLLCASFPRHQLWWHHTHWTQIGFRTLPKVPPPLATSLRWPEQALENLSLVDAWLSLLWVHLSALFPILLSSPFYPG